MHHVIIGGGPAGVIAAETIRKLVPHDNITIISDEAEPPYSRMAIPYLLMGNVKEDGTYLRKSASHLQDLHINWVQASVKRVDSATKKIVLDKKSDAKSNTKSDAKTDINIEVTFDTLLIATGSHPIKPPIPGIESAGVHTCWTMDDARKIMALATKDARVLQLGAGFIGCIIMESLAVRGVKLSVVEMGDRMVPRMMGPTAGGMIRDWVQSKGVEVFTATKVESIEAGKPLKVKLSNGKTVEADLVISAAGVRPAIGFLKNSGITCLLGVLTDAHLQTNVPGIFAAGDCAEAFDQVTGKTVVSAIQPNAAEQARVAAMNMVASSRGKTMQAELKSVTQINVLDTLGLISTSFGDWQGQSGGEHVELTDLKQGRHLSLQFKDDVLVGCNSVGWTDHVGVMRGLVEGKVKLGAWKDHLKADPTKLMQAYIASAQGQQEWAGAQDERRR